MTPLTQTVQRSITDSSGIISKIGPLYFVLKQGKPEPGKLKNKMRQFGY